MHWTCPACHLQVAHSEADSQPRWGVVYRCHVCRLELTLAEDGVQLTIAPMPDEREPDGNRPPG